MLNSKNEINHTMSDITIDCNNDTNLKENSVVIKEDSIVITPEVKKKKASGKDKKEEPATVEIPYSKIKKSNVIISFK